ncbi:MAG: NAD-dependent epimerase/dehydratase family protein [Planctomycetes bacterium]|nr:NAD-dependent epimerase/dehydratase family protein [Planctomycetota bacterium]
MPDKVLLLGAAGTVGSRVAHALIDAGYRLISLARSRGHRNLGEIESRGGEIRYGDMNDDAALKSALEGCRYFVHSAAPYPPSGLHLRLPGYLAKWPGQIRRQFALAKIAGVERAVYTSSLSTIGLAEPGKLADESLPFDPARQRGGNYYPVKAALEKAVLEATTGANPIGPPTVIVNPTGLVGEGSRNVKLSAVCVFYQGLSPFMVDAPMSFVDCHDVGRGHALALQKGRPGERYILGGWNTTLKDFAATVASLAGIRRPPVVPRFLAHWAALASEWTGLITGSPGALSLTSYYHLRYGQHYSWEKARRELGYEPANDLTPAILRELRWHGVIPNATEATAESR